jgi:hypothetical protein
LKTCELWGDAGDRVEGAGGAKTKDDEKGANRVPMGSEGGVVGVVMKEGQRNLREEIKKMLVIRSRVSKEVVEAEQQ